MFKDDQEAQDFINSLTTPQTTSLTSETLLQDNEEIIKHANDILIERLKHKDGSLRVQDIVSAKESAFKQNQKILWLDDDDKIDLIPATINIQVINNK